MPRPKKKGLDYSPWDTNIFENDTKIDELIDAQGWSGFAVYFYLCQKAYASDGFFYRWSYANAATTARRMGGGIGSETVKQVVSVCLRIGLFDKRLFDEAGVLTSKGIQRRYMSATGRRKPHDFDETLWLLGDDEDVSEVNVYNNTLNVCNNPYNSDNNSPKTKVNKTKENKTKENSSNAPAPVREELLSLVSFYEQGAGTFATPYFGESLTHFEGLLGYDVVKHGIEAAFNEGKTTPKYILAILRRYEQEGLDTLEKVERSERQFERDQQRRGKGGGTAASRSVKKPEEYSKGGFLDDDAV